MKKELVLILLITVVIILSGCAGKQDINTSNGDIEITLTPGGSKFFIEKLMAEIFTGNILVCEETDSGNKICQLDKDFKLGEDILVDCAKNYQNKNSKYNFEGKHSCIFFSEQVKYYLDFIKSGEYEFNSVLGAIELIDIQKIDGCPKYGNVVIERGEISTPVLSSPSFPIMTDIGVIESNLYVCNQ